MTWPMIEPMNARPDPDYPHWDTITTRWMDNDMYGHVNNVQYYSFFDTVVTSWLVREGGLDPRNGAVIGLCVESQCTYSAPLSFPDEVLAGLRVGNLGRSSVRYEIVLYRPVPIILRRRATSSTCTSTGCPAGRRRSRNLSGTRCPHWFADQLTGGRSASLHPADLAKPLRQDPRPFSRSDRRRGPGQLGAEGR